MKAALKDTPIRGRREASALVQAATYKGRWQIYWKFFREELEVNN
ncbi:MAG: hypothetical protein AAFW67_14050 [Cyanobacteria bacterium J06638_38]